MWTISELKQRGKAAFKANYWMCVLTAFLMSLFTGSASMSSGSGGKIDELKEKLSNMDSRELTAVIIAVAAIVSVALIVALVLRIFLANPIAVGGSLFFLSNTEQPPAPFNLVGSGFKNYLHTFVTLLLRDVFLLLWSLLFLIPGFIKAYSYRMVPYILAENPDMPAKEIITRSREMMNGHKWRAFVLDLSFIGWILLGALTCGLVLIFWTGPYKQSTDAALYLKLSREEQYRY